MPRVHFVKKARKDNPACKAGESYYWWKFRFGGTHYSKEAPKASQLTQSDFLSRAYELNERIEDLQPGSVDDLISEVEDISNEFQNLGDECQDKLGAMPEQLQESSDAGQLLQERIDACEGLVNDLGSVDMEIDEDSIREEVTSELSGELKRKPTESEIDEAVADRIQERMDEILLEVQSFSYDGG